MFFRFHSVASFSSAHSHAVSKPAALSQQVTHARTMAGIEARLGMSLDDIIQKTKVENKV